ncbi:MAG: hypothetical protein JST92_03515, partial [Deltaproteobacteria bacterium]|nr:hypothetical protein [Deltaproteobacteria bacterium]
SAATGPDDDKPDAAAKKACEADIARLSLEKCSFDGRFPIEDDKGKLAVSARPCAEALMRVLAKTMTQVSGGDARAPEAEESAQAPKAQPRGPKAKKTKAADAPLKI